MSRCEFGLGFLILITPWMPRHVSALWGRFNMTVYQVVNHDKFNPRLYFRSFLCGWRNTDKYFCRPTHLRIRQKTATTFNHRLYFVLDATIKCIWIKIQLIVEFNLDFQDLCQYLPNVPKNRSTTNGRILGQFCAGGEIRTNIFTPRHIFLYIPENSDRVQP